MAQETSASQETMRNALGQDVPVNLVKEFDKVRNTLVLDLIERYEHASAVINSLREYAVNEVDTLMKLSAERFGENLGGQKGNATIYSYDGNFKIIRAVQGSLFFDEGLTAAKELIDQCLNDWTQGSDEKVRMLIERAFRPSSCGRMSTSAVLGLRSLAINDERWIRAMHAITESVKAMNCRTQIRAYKRNEAGGWQQINID